MERATGQFRKIEAATDRHITTLRMLVAAAAACATFAYYLRDTHDRAVLAMPAGVALDSIHDLRVEVDGLRRYADSLRAEHSTFTTRRLCAKIPRPKPSICQETD